MIAALFKSKAIMKQSLFYLINAQESFTSRIYSDDKETLKGMQTL
jgi:hypothetical protein